MMVPVGRDVTLSIPIDHGGPNVLEIEAEAGPQELTLANNRAAVVVNGVRDRLRVLLVSGEPHAGERVWRNILKSDPSVDLVHFTILRPPEKQDGTPIRELSLIAFPIRELFDVKLDEFDLIIFDRYSQRGIIPQAYIDNVVRYVRKGGALLEAAGPTFGTPMSLFRTPLGEILPTEPTGDVREQGFKPQLTALGRRHPVTADLPGAGKPGEAPSWGRWFRQVEGRRHSGTAIMSGENGGPLLVLDRVGKGRVAQLLSDQMWLWARGFEGGGPQAELLRRLAYWLMKEPDLEENDLRAVIEGDQLKVTRQSLEPDDSPVTITAPDGTTSTLTLTPAEGGRSIGTAAISQMGLYRVSDGTRTALAAAGPLNPVEFADVRTTAEKLGPIVEASGGGVFWVGDGCDAGRAPRIPGPQRGRPRLARAAPQRRLCRDRVRRGAAVAGRRGAAAGDRPADRRLAPRGAVGTCRLQPHSGPWRAGGPERHGPSLDIGARRGPMLHARHRCERGHDHVSSAFAAAALLALAANAAQAHTGIGSTAGFGHGFAHPLGGIDHVLAMVAVGLFAAQLGGRALWLVPLSFVAMMVVGGAVGMAGIGLPLGRDRDRPFRRRSRACGRMRVSHAGRGRDGAGRRCSRCSTVTRTAPRCRNRSRVLSTRPVSCWRPRCCTRSGSSIGLGLGRAGAAIGRRALQIAGSAIALAGIAILAGNL